jgi:predicted PurR-regulated permease PerM
VLATFLGVFAGGLLWGIAGMFLSVLFLGVLRIAFSATPALEPWGELLAEPEHKRKPVFRRLSPHKAAA